MNSFNSHEENCSLSSAGLFEDRLRQEDVIKGYWEKVNPINSLDGTQVMEFLVKWNKDFIDLHNCYIKLKIRITNTDGTNLAENKEIGCINYTIAALFEHVVVYLNNYIQCNYIFIVFCENIPIENKKTKIEYSSCAGL